MGYLTSTGEVELMRYLMASRMANPTLQWEKTKSWNFALDFGFLNDRITGTMEFYTMNTNDMIMSQPLPVFTGFNNITTNLGQVNNTGFEFSLNTVNIKQKNLNGIQRSTSPIIRIKSSTCFMNTKTYWMLIVM